MNKKTKSIFIAGIATSSLGLSLFAAPKRPVDVLVDLTGESQETLYEKRASGKSYGQIAADYGVSDEFRTVNMEERIANYKNRVNNGTMTQEQLDAVLERMGNCTGTPGENSGEMGLGNGQGAGQGNPQGGRGQGNPQGSRGSGRGRNR